VIKAGTGTGVVTSSPTGFVCGTVCSLNLAQGRQLTLIATPDPGFAFVGWGGACTGTGTCPLTVNSALTITATFQ